MDTPMGPTIFIERIYMDDLKTRIETYVIDEIAYDITDKSAENILAYMDEKYQLSKKMKKYYDMSLTPNLKFKLKYNEQVFEVGYCGSIRSLEEEIRAKLNK